MINFKNTNISFALLLFFAMLWDFVYGLSAWVYFGLYLSYSALFFYGVFNISSNFFVTSICSKATGEKVIAISFDDGPTGFTPEILQTLDTKNVKAAFFCIGKRIETNEALFQQIHRQGHLIGNHTYSHHLLFDFFPGKIMLMELQRMDSICERLIGCKPILFRPPYGVTVPWLHSAITLGGYLSVGWSVRSLDTITKNRRKLLKKVTNGLRPGAVYLFHDTNINTTAVLPEFIDYVQANGYSIVRMDKMLSLPVNQRINSL